MVKDLSTLSPVPGYPTPSPHSPVRPPPSRFRRPRPPDDLPASHPPDDGTRDDGMEGLRRTAGGRGTFARGDERGAREGDDDPRGSGPLQLASRGPDGRGERVQPSHGRAGGCGRPRRARAAVSVHGAACGGGGARVAAARWQRGWRVNLATGAARCPPATGHWQRLVVEGVDQSPTAYGRTNGVAYARTSPPVLRSLYCIIRQLAGIRRERHRSKYQYRA